MARTQEKDKDKIEISQYILEKVPREAEVTRIEYEGPMLAVYTKKPDSRVPDEVRPRAIDDGSPLPAGQAMIEREEGHLVEPQTRHEADPLGAGGQIDHDQFVGCHRHRSRCGRPVG